MAFNQRELDIIKYGVENGKSRQEIEGAISNLRLGIVPKKEEPQKETIPAEPSSSEPSIASKLGERAGSVVNEITGKPASDILKTANTESGQDIALTGAQALARTAQAPLRVAGALGGAVGDVIDAGIEKTGLAEALNPIVAPVAQTLKPIVAPVAQTLKPIVAPVAQTLKPEIELAVNTFKSLPKDTQETLSSLLDAANLPLLGLGKKVGEKVGEKVLEKVADISQKTNEAVKPIIEKSAGVAKGLAGDVSLIPSRIATNLEAKQAKMQIIDTLPTETAKLAARNGIDIPDVKEIYSIPKENIPTVKELADTAKKFAMGETKTDPIEIVGKPIVQRIKELNSARVKVGQELGAIANNLGVVSREELFTPVFESIKKVPGLDGITVGKNGILNFENTTLATTRNAPARKYIQSVFDDATKDGTGKQKHLLRQELFEELGGKKKSQIALTETEEKSIDAIRKGLSDVLESKNEGYKSKSAEFRKIIKPLTDMKKLLRNIDPKASDDILNMSAGILARRLTSNAPSRVQLKQILKEMDAATSVEGGTQISVENLQDIYNILDKYYDIAGKTSFQGQTRAGIEKATGVGELVVGQARELAGETTAVRQKALEDSLREVLGS